MHNLSTLEKFKTLAMKRPLVMESTEVTKKSQKEKPVKMIGIYM